VIGEGTFGTVYAAEQESPVRRRVALKIVKAGMDSREVVARFEQERQALALMDHPNIARVFDGGSTPNGRPFFVMELVKGDPITEYCDREKLTTAERLRLFVDVGRAVQHAHTKGVIQLENGARFRVDCKVDGGKLTVEKITHTKSATNGRLRIITNEKGNGTVTPVAFALDYTYHSEMPNKKETMRGKIRITFPK